METKERKHMQTNQNILFLLYLVLANKHYVQQFFYLY